MRNMLIALAALAAAAPAAAQHFPGEIIAEFYMNEMSIPKGWTLSYKGIEGGTHVFIMDRDLDAHPQTSFLQPIDQLRRLMCGDDALASFVTGGTAIRIDRRDKQGGRTELTKGPTLTRCN